MTPSLTEDQIMGALGDFIVQVLPGMKVVQGQDNRVPPPSVANWVAMTPARREQLALPTTDYAPGAGTKDVGQSISLHFQLDFYGASSSDNAQTVTTLLRDEYGATFFAARALAPLYCDDGQQMPLITGEDQWLQRWMMRGVLQTNLSITVPAEFANTLSPTLVEADR